MDSAHMKFQHLVHSTFPQMAVLADHTVVSYATVSATQKANKKTSQLP
jgi:hypothetical protein